MEILYWLIGSHIVSALGITIGYHRLLTHRSFKCPRWVENFWVTLGFLTWMGSPISWVAVHRYHHANSDKEDDPHSPNKGWKHAQYGWVLERAEERRLARTGMLGKTKYLDTFSDDSPDLQRWAKDLYQDPYYRKLTAPVCLFLSILTLIGCYYLGGLPAVVGRLLAIGTVIWCTWFVNSWCHTQGVWSGYRNFKTNDTSQNVWWVALITNGEGWHNNHHAQPASARHGMKWWEIDLAWGVIWLMELFGLATKVHTFTNHKNDQTDVT